jgi:hypothetical protein
VTDTLLEFAEVGGQLAGDGLGARCNTDLYA